MAHFDKHFTLEQANTLLPWIRSVFAEVHQLLAQVAGETKAAPAGLTGPGVLGEPPQPVVIPIGKTNGHGHGNGNGNGYGPGSGLGSGLGSVPIPSAEVTPVWAGLAREEKIELINRLLQALIEDGIVVQDIKRGLIDFPAWRADEEVLLCYELSDGEQIVAWHPLHAGYAGRQPIDEFDDEG